MVLSFPLSSVHPFSRLSSVAPARPVRSCSEMQASGQPCCNRVTTGTASADIFFAARPEANLVIRQYLTKRTGEKSICLSVFNAVGGGVPIHHLPPHTYPVLRALGIPVWGLGSRVRWMVSLLVYWLYGCWMIVKLGRSTAEKNSELNAGSSAFFRICLSMLFPTGKLLLKGRTLSAGIAAGINAIR